jgi:hypothetical protein
MPTCVGVPLRQLAVAIMRETANAARMKRLVRFCYGAALIVAGLIIARWTIPPSETLFREHAGTMVALGIGGWLLATLGPIALSMATWKLKSRFDRGWAPHALFMLLANLVYYVGASTLFHAAGESNGDSLEGYALLAASCCLVVLLAFHAAALVASGPMDKDNRT